MFDTFLSHPDKQYENHIVQMFDEKDTPLERAVKTYHDIAKLKHNFQLYIRDTKKGVVDKDHSLLSAYLFLLNNDFGDLEMLFGFFSIVSHHGYVENFFQIKEDNKNIGKHCTSLKELRFLDEVLENADKLALYKGIQGEIKKLEELSIRYQRYLMHRKFIDKFTYRDFINFKKIYASLIYSDKYEAIFSLPKEKKKVIDERILESFIDSFPYHEKRDTFRKFVLKNFDNKHKLFTLTAPTGYGKTLTALQFALKLQKEKIIFALPFTSIIDQTQQVISDIFKDSEIDIFKVHHKTTIDEDVDEDRYSKIKFLMSSFSGEINITTLYQIIFALFGNSNKDNIKFNQFRNAVVIIDEAQAIPYKFRQDFIKLCEVISETMDTIFIFMSATMPIMSDGFKEVSNLGYFEEQNRYVLKWLELENGQDSLENKIKLEADYKHTLCVVNTIKKAQEIYLTFKDEYECYCLNGYMTDKDKQKTVSKIQKRLKQDKKKVLLISTQSIEAGIDLDFEVGFREIAPISSIIQTAGRVNRHFGEKQGVLYIFEDICEYSDLIYGDLQHISRAIFEVFKNGDVEESDILAVSERYFEKIHKQLETYLLEDEMKELKFFDINDSIKNEMDQGGFKQLIIIEPYNGFIKEIEQEIFKVRNSNSDIFKQKDQVGGVVKKLLQYGVNVARKDIEKFQTNLEEVKALHEMFYLPVGAFEYDSVYGVKKYQLEVNEDDIFC